jgi:drug/metabolite transporter (DMT)-like permease
MIKNSNLRILIVLGIIWSSFAIFTKFAAEEFSPFFIAFSRLAIGGVILIFICLIKKKKIHLGTNLKKYTIVGFFNSAFPFTLFAMSAKNLDSGIVAILDGTVPMFEVLITMFFFKNYVNKSAILGIIFGIIGIIFISYESVVEVDIGNLVPVIAILIATASYAVASLYINANCKNIDPLANAAGSVLVASIMLLPSLFFTDLSLINMKSGLSLLGLGTLCTGIAYVFYFKLVAEEGPRTAVSVVLLIPIFGMIYGAIFVGETITLTKIIGCVTILISMKFILNLSLKHFTKSLPIV